MTRKLTSLLALTLTLSLVSFAQAGSAAASAPTTATAAKLGVINLQAAIVNTNEGRRDFESLQKKFEPKSAELKTMRDDIDNLTKQLQAQADKLSAEERDARGRVIEQKQKTYQVNAENAQSDFAAQQNEIANRILSKMGDVLDKYAKANNLTMVVDVSTQQSPILWAADQVNITPQIVEAYNAASGITAPAAPAAARPAAAPARPATGGTAAPAAPKKPATTGTTPR